MWVVENKDKVFFYQDNGGWVEGSLQNNHLPFTIGIQIEWQKTNDVMTWPWEWHFY
jgi:hypothetical protein